MCNMPMPNEIQNNHWQQPGDQAAEVQVHKPMPPTSDHCMLPDGFLIPTGLYLRWRKSFCLLAIAHQLAEQ